MKTLRRCVILSLGLAAASAGPAAANNEPRGLLLRKGLVSWQVTLDEARKFVEADIHPNIPVLLTSQKRAGFGCEPEGNRGVTRCTWACCVSLGEQDVVHFATLWFLNDRFYAYDVTFNIGLFPSLHSNLTSEFGAPSRETQETLVNPGVMLGGVGSYVANTKRWNSGDAVVLLSDRGGQGSPLVGHIYVTYLPLAQEAVPLAKPQPRTGTKLPF